MTRRRTLTEAQRSAYERHFDLGALFDFSTIINSSLDLKFILGHLLLTIMGKLLSVRGIVLLHKEGSTYVVETMRGPVSETAGESYEWKSLPAKIVYVKDARNQTWARFFRRHGIEVIAPVAAR